MKRKVKSKLKMGSLFLGLILLGFDRVSHRLCFAKRQGTLTVEFDPATVGSFGLSKQAIADVMLASLC